MISKALVYNYIWSIVPIGSGISFLSEDIYVVKLMHICKPRSYIVNFSDYGHLQKHLILI